MIEPKAFLVRARFREFEWIHSDCAATGTTRQTRSPHPHEAGRLDAFRTGMRMRDQALALILSIAFTSKSKGGFRWRAGTPGRSLTIEIQTESRGRRGSADPVAGRRRCQPVHCLLPKSDLIQRSLKDEESADWRAVSGKDVRRRDFLTWQKQPYLTARKVCGSRLSRVRKPWGIPATSSDLTSN
ncbi:MAG: hypothetical protein ACK526_15955 [Planctomyces sp.]|jgi:hypothetical protein